MQILQIDESQELANMLEGAAILSTIDHAGIRLYVVNRDGKDSLIFSGTNNSGFVDSFANVDIGEPVRVTVTKTMSFPLIGGRQGL